MIFYYFMSENKKQKDFKKYFLQMMFNNKKIESAYLPGKSDSMRTANKRSST